MKGTKDSDGCYLCCEHTCIVCPLPSVNGHCSREVHGHCYDNELFRNNTECPECGRPLNFADIIND